MNNALLTLEARLFLEECIVRDLEGEEAQEVVAACLAGGLTLEKMQ